MFFVLEVVPQRAAYLGSSLKGTCCRRVRGPREEEAAGRGQPEKRYVPTEEPQMGDQDKDPGGTHKSTQKGGPSFSHVSCPEGHGDDRAEPVLSSALACLSTFPVCLGTDIYKGPNEDVNTYRSQSST